MRPDSPEWLATKRLGDEAEAELCAMLSSWGAVAGVRAIGRAPGADLAVMMALEIKADGEAARTGNVAIEVEYRGQASGLRTTRAALWAIRAGGEWFIVPVVTLKRLAASAPVVSANGGQTRVALVRLQALRTVALVVRRGAGG